MIVQEKLSFSCPVMLVPKHLRCLQEKWLIGLVGGDARTALSSIAFVHILLSFYQQGCLCPYTLLFVSTMKSLSIDFNICLNKGVSLPIYFNICINNGVFVHIL